MEILVCIKRVPLVGSTFILTDDASEIDTRRLGFTLSPHEECAVEAAVQLRDAHGGSVTLLSLGTAETEEQLREQLAIGADRAILAITDGSEPDPQATAAALLEAIRADGAPFDLVLLGSESADVAGYQTGIRLAHALGLPVVTGVKGLTVEAGVARCERAVGSEREVYSVALPAVITVKDGLNPAPSFSAIFTRSDSSATSASNSRMLAEASDPSGEAASSTGEVRRSR